VKAGRQSFGLQIMGERAASVGVALEIDSGPNQGTRVVIRMPFTPGEY
jgi:signal transduction histidine kinase